MRSSFFKTAARAAQAARRQAQQQGTHTASGHPLDLITLPANSAIPLRGNPASQALRATVLTDSAAKFGEFQQILGMDYGMDVQQLSFNGSSCITRQALAAMQLTEFTPHFLLDESSSLRLKDNSEDITHLSLIELAKHHLDNVVHTSQLAVLKPIWQKQGGNKWLSGFTRCYFSERVYGYLDLDRHPDCTHGFGWDSLFIHATTGLSNEDSFSLYGKQSARQHTASHFINDYLRYKRLHSLKHHQIESTQAIDFGANHPSVRQFVASSEHLSNPYANQWGIAALLNHTIDQGVFFKAAWSRPGKNYFSPPFSGIPLVPKQGAAEETIFTTHDMLHHAIPDLICDLPASQQAFQVYWSWRMCSEAFTLVLADMFYADGLVRSGVDESHADKRIYPLFKAVKHAQNIDDGAKLSPSLKHDFIKQLIGANVSYALHGDDSAWRTLLTDDNGTISEHARHCLTAYTNHFEKFFIGDNVWTHANYVNMNKPSSSTSQWITEIGRDNFRQSNIPLLSDALQTIEQSGVDFSDYRDIAHAVFEHLFETRIQPQLNMDRSLVHGASDSTIQSRAFRRYLIGQSSFFSQYATPPHLHAIKSRILDRIKNPAPFSNDEQDRIRDDIKRYILGIEGLRLMTRAEAKNADDCVAVFPPVYISYDDEQRKHQNIASSVAGILDTTQRDMTSAAHIAPQHTRIIDGVTFIDTIALEEAIPPNTPTADRLRQKMIRAGVEFWNEQQTIVKTPAIGINAIGGLSIYFDQNTPADCIQLRYGDTLSEPITLTQLADGLRHNMGMQSAHSYQNPQGKKSLELYQTTVKHKHFSAAHAANVGITCFGISKKNELELVSQRDLAHFARTTSARSACQDDPCLFAMTKAGAQVSEDMLSVIMTGLAALDSDKKTKDWREQRNALYPLSACQSIGINVSLRNLQKLLSDASDLGKEKEYRDTLTTIQTSFNALLPELFRSPTMPSTKSATATAPTTSLFAKSKAKRAILFFGAPGIGKSTQTKLLCQQSSSIMRISTGELVRALDEKVMAGAKLSAVEQHASESLQAMRDGGLMDNDAVYALLMAHISPGGAGHKSYQAADTIILDGVIKAPSSVKSFHQAFDDFNARSTTPMRLNTVINLCASEKQMLARHQRRIEESGGQQRPDDRPEIQQKRLQAYNTTNAELMAIYHKNPSIQCHQVDTQEKAEDTHALIRRTISDEASAQQTRPFKK